MGAIQSGINQAIQTAAIIGQLQEIPQKKAERKMAAAELEDIEKEKSAYKEYFKNIDDPEIKKEEYENKEKFLKELRQQENETRLKYQKAGGKEGKYSPVKVDPQERIGEIGIEDFPGQVSLKYEYGISTPKREQKQNFDMKKAQMANTMAQSQREIYNQMTNLFKKFDTEGYNGK